MQGFARSNYVTQLGSLTATNDDVLQFKAGALVNRSLAQLRSDTGVITNRAIHTDATAVWAATNSPNSERAFANTTVHYTKVDATFFKECRLNCRVTTASASVNTPRIYMQYSTDGGVNWITVGAGTVASGEAISLATAATGLTTSWIAVPVGAMGDFQWRLAENGGDGAADPALSAVYFEFR